MNAAIASASLLGFGDKPASQSMQSFAETLNKMYETQLKAFKGEETSRKSAIEEYNKQQRAKKKKESDIQELLKKMGGGEGEGEKTKKKKGGGLLTALLGGTALVGGAALLAPVIAPLVVGIASKALGDMLTKKVKEMVDPIVESITKPFDLFFKEQEGGEEGEEEVPDGMVRNADGRLVPSDMPSSRDMDIEEIMVENADGRMVPREMPASRNMDVEDKSPAQAVSDAVSPSTSSDSGGGTAWDPVLEMISSAESRGRYDIIYGGEIIDGITEMTIAQAAKRAGDRGDGSNYAVGKYQFITLVEQAKAAGLNPNKDKFSPKNQDKIAIDLITRKRGVTKQMAKNNPKEAGKRLAMEWAGLPVLAPTKGHKRDVSRGQSYYAGDGVNKSTITPEQVEASFQKLQKGGEVKENKVVTKKKNEIISKYKGDERAKLGALENRKFKEKSPLFQETNPIKKQKGGLILFAGHTDVPIGHSQPGTDAPGTPLQNKYKPTAEQHFANKVGSQTASLAQNQDVSISFRPAKGRYASTSDPNSNWAQIKSIRSQGGSAIDLHFDAYGYEKGKLIQGARGFIGNGFNLTDIEKKVAEKFGNHPTGTTFPVPILELDPINKAPGSVNTYAQMIVNAVKGVSGADNVTAQEETVKVSPVSQSVAGGSRGENPQDLKDNKKSTPTQSTSTTTEETNKTGVAAILQAAEENTGIGAGQSMQCANTTRQVLRAAGHPDANKTTKKGDLDAEGLKYSAPSFAASFAGTDMGQIKESTSALAPGDIVLWKNTFSSMGGDKPGAITHVGIKGKGADVYHHGSGPGWRKTAMFDGGKFAYGVTLSGSNSATGENLNTTSNNTTGSSIDSIFNNFASQLLGDITETDTSTLGGILSGGGIDAIFANAASQLLAPILGSIASIVGVPLPGSSETTESTSTTSGGGGGDASNVAGISLGSTEYVKLMKETMDKGGITNKNERIMFMAQVGHESGDGQYMEEIADGSAYEGRSDLGNTQPGDGKRYKGRGYIQITGRANYAKYGPMIGVPDAVENPEKLAQPQNAAKVALAYWLDRVDRSAAQKGMDGMRTVTRNINGGLNGLSDRIAKFQKYSKMPEISASSSPVMAQKGGMIESNLIPTKLQQGGTVGGQINTGTMRGVQNTNITKLKEMSQKMKKRGPKVIRVQAPPTEAPKPIIASSGGKGQSTPQGGMIMSELADYMHRVSMGALA